ncbi:MAG: ThiF family adenylyltransferase [Planctomycetes bacterium]|nr:ThiF family adenylyltransferase [Planctomycetota bacterium]
MNEDRFDRLRRIRGWDQERLARAKVLLVGAGALGNEILKNLALVGVGRVFIVDPDRIENSNLSRSVLYRESDEGRPKAEAAARAAKSIYPALRAVGQVGRVPEDVGLGVFRWADVVLAGLDSREARLAVNRGSALTGKTWIDGAIEVFNGVARVFRPSSGPCYECTMNRTDWEMVERRRACSLLTRDEMLEGKVPTTPTMASIVGALQSEQAIRFLHGMETIEGKGLVLNGSAHDHYVVEYPRKPDCCGHEWWESVTVLEGGAGTCRAGDLLEQARSDLGGDAVLEFREDLISALTCDSCGEREPRFTALGRIREREAKCPKCAAPRRPEAYHTIEGSEPFLDRPLAELGVPPFDVVAARSDGRHRAYELGGDRERVLGEAL